jgi:hypothetical protein
MVINLTLFALSMASANVFNAGQIRKLEAIIGNKNMFE